MVLRNLVLRERMTALIGIALLLALVGLSYYYSIRITLEGLKYVPSLKSPDFIAKDVVVTDFDKDGTLLRRLLSQNVEHYSDGQMNAADARLQSFSKNRAPIYLASDKAWSKDSLQTLELGGNVRINQPADAKNPAMSFKTEYLKGYLDNDYFETDKPVFMTRGEGTTQAKGGMTFDNISRIITLTGNVVSVFHQTSNKR